MQKLETQLENRTLRYDGVSIVTVDGVIEALLRHVPLDKLRVVGDTDGEVERFNQHVGLKDQLKSDFPEPISMQMQWSLPEKYLLLDLEQFIIHAFEKKLPSLNYDDEQMNEAVNRIDLEITEVYKRGMTEFVKTIIYIIDRFKETNTVWGVGRGSSCASYILFILGLHVVDCVKYSVPAEEFFHD